MESYQAGMGHLPIRGPYECLTFSAGITVLFYLWVEWKFKTRTFGAFVVSFAASILFVLNGAGIITPTNALKKLFISSDLLDDMSYKMIAIGFVMFSIMIVTGMFRSKIIWGRYWEWDPVQTWSLLTWIVYAVILHGRYTWKWRGGITAILSIIGFGLSVVELPHRSRLCFLEPALPDYWIAFHLSENGVWYSIIHLSCQITTGLCWGKLWKLGSVRT